jgi:hypothetical protein
LRVEPPQPHNTARPRAFGGPPKAMGSWAIHTSYKFLVASEGFRRHLVKTSQVKSCEIFEFGTPTRHH